MKSKKGFEPEDWRQKYRKMVKRGYPNRYAIRFVRINDIKYLWTVLPQKPCNKKKTIKEARAVAKLWDYSLKYLCVCDQNGNIVWEGI